MKPHAKPFPKMRLPDGATDDGRWQVIASTVTGRHWYLYRGTGPGARWCWCDKKGALMFFTDRDWAVAQCDMFNREIDG